MKLKKAFRFLLYLGLIWCVGLMVYHHTIPLNEEYLPDFSLLSVEWLNRKDAHRQDGPALFAEFHQLIRTREGEPAPDYEPNYQLMEFRKAIRKRPKSRNGEPLPWLEKGPGNVGGRTRGIWVDPSDERHLTWFAGSVGGGIWKTEDGGATWQHLTEDLTNLGTSTIAGSASNADMLYVGTGEGFNTADISGNGIWKSTDRGENWFPLESTLHDPRFVHILRMVVDPSDEDKIVVATRVSRRVTTGDGEPRSYIFKSEDGGQTWSKTMENTSVVQQIVAHPHTFDTLYAAINSSGIARSADGGDTWELIFDISNLSINRLELAIAPTNPEVLYFSAYTNQGVSRLYRSGNSGMEWYEVRGIDNQNRFGNWMGGQGWYNNTLAVHPFDAQTVLAGGQGAILRITVKDTLPDENNLLKGTMFPVTDGYGQYANRYNTSSKGVHVDHHNLILLPIDETTGQFFIINANDGGIAFSTNSGDTFVQTGDAFNEEGNYVTNKGYNTAQFYGVDKRNGAERYVGGTQDNGSWISPMNPDAASSWVWTPSGDGFEAAWHYWDPNKVLESSQFNNIYRSDDGGNSWRNINPPGDGPFITRIANSKIDPDMVFAVARQGVVRSLNFGDNWEIIDMPEKWQFTGAAQVRISLASPLVIWSGSGLTESSRLAVSIDGGAHFSTTGFYEKATLGAISGLATHPVNEQTAYALFSMANGPKILKTNDWGRSWEDLSGFVTNTAESRNGFPDAATYSLLVMPFDTNRIWVGTEIGLFESLDGGQQWHYADNGLPPVSIWDMKIVNNEIIIATHGRGVWSVAMPELNGYEPPQALAYLPSLQIRGSGLGGRVVGDYSLRSVYDSAFIEVGLVSGTQVINVKRSKLEQQDEPVHGVFDFLLEGVPDDTLARAQIKVLAYKNGIELTNTTKAYVFEVEKEALSGYRTDFDDGRQDFARLGFNIYQEPGFGSKAMHSPHPYLGFYQTYIAVLQYPVIVSQINPLLIFDEIAMVEPGEDGTVFGDFEFWDYVVVEGTKDRGLNWETIEGYDSRWSENWLNNYVENGGPIDPSLMETHSMDLSSVFNPGDTIFLRFLLQSDPYAEGWGWVIDNLSIQENPTSSREEEDTRLESIVVYPNPASEFIRIQYRLTEKLNVKVDLYAISGKFLCPVERGVKWPGEHHNAFDAGDLPPGIYIFRIEAGGKVEAVKWVKM